MYSETRLSAVIALGPCTVGLEHTDRSSPTFPHSARPACFSLLAVSSPVMRVWIIIQIDPSPSPSTSRPNLSLDGRDGLGLLSSSGDALGLGDLDVRGREDDLNVRGVSLVRVDSSVGSESSSVGFLIRKKVGRKKSVARLSLASDKIRRGYLRGPAEHRCS